MIAEIHNKISTSGSNLSERREDLLTGNVFGSLRYLQFQEGYQRVLKRVIFSNPRYEEKWLNSIAECSWSNTETKFWERMDGREIDFVIHGPNDLLIGCEVKYLSWLSSDDEVGNGESIECQDENESINQLSEYAISLERRSSNSFLILVAPKDKGFYIISDVQRRGIVPSAFPLGLLLWESIFDEISLAHASALDLPTKCLFGDILALLERKNLRNFPGWGKLPTISGQAYIFNTHAFDWRGALLRGGMAYEFQG